jgi:hypothetical protein
MPKLARVALTATLSTILSVGALHAETAPLDGAGFYAKRGGWQDFYLGIGGQGSRINGGSVTNIGACGGNAFFDCPGAASGTHTLFDAKWGGGFRVEAGWRLRWARVFTLFQGNYWNDVSGPVMGGRPGDFGTLTIDTYAYTWTFGVGFDSAVLWPRLLPPGWNLGIQGSLGPTWNTLGRLRASGFQSPSFVAFEVDGGTHTALAFEFGTFLQYALNDRVALQIGYASKWLGPFRGHGGLESVTIDGLPVSPQFVEGVTTNNRRVDEINLQIVFRPNK